MKSIARTSGAVRFRCAPMAALNRRLLGVLWRGYVRSYVTDCVLSPVKKLVAAFTGVQRRLDSRTALRPGSRVVDTKRPALAPHLRPPSMKAITGRESFIAHSSL